MVKDNMYINKVNNKLDFIVDILDKLKYKQNLKNFLNDILTPQEIEILYERLYIIRLLKQGLTQREIAEKLGVSITTVNKGSRVLKYGSGVFENIDL